MKKCAQAQTSLSHGMNKTNTQEHNNDAKCYVGFKFTSLKNQEW